MLTSTKFRPGERIITVGHCRVATVIPEKLFFTHCSGPPADRGYASFSLKPAFDSYHIVFVRWESTGEYDWYWEAQCELMPSASLAREAGNV